MPESSLSGEIGMVTPFQVRLWLGGGEMYFILHLFKRKCSLLLGSDHS